MSERRVANVVEIEINVVVAVAPKPEASAFGNPSPPRRRQ